MAITKEDYMIAHEVNLLLQKLKDIKNSIDEIEVQKKNAIINEDYLLANDLLVKIQNFSIQVDEINNIINTAEPESEEIIVLVIEEEASTILEEETYRIAVEKEKASRIAVEEQASRITVEEETIRIAAEEEEAFRIAVEEDETFRIVAEEEAYHIATEEEASRIAAEEEASHIAAEEEELKKEFNRVLKKKISIDKKTLLKNKGNKKKSIQTLNSQLAEINLEYKTILDTHPIKYIDMELLKKHYPNDYCHVLERDIYEMKIKKNKRKEIESKQKQEILEQEEKRIFMEFEEEEMNKIRSNMKQKDIALIDITILVLKVIHNMYSSSSIINSQFNTCDFGKIMSKTEDIYDNIKFLKKLKISNLLNFFAKEDNIVFQYNDMELNLSINMEKHPTIISSIEAPESYNGPHKWYKLTNFVNHYLKDFINNLISLSLKDPLKYTSAISRDKVKKEFITITFENDVKKEYEFFTNHSFRSAWKKVPKEKENILDFKELQSTYLCVCSSCMASNPHWIKGQYHECGLKYDLDNCPEVADEYKYCIYGPYCDDDECEWNHLDKSEPWINKHFFCKPCLEANDDTTNKFNGLTLQDEFSIQSSENNMELTKFKKKIYKSPCLCLNHFKTIFDTNKLLPITGCYYGANCGNPDCSLKYGHGYTMNIHNTIYNHACIGRKCTDRPQMVNYRGYRKYNDSNIEDGYYCNTCNYYNNQHLNKSNSTKNTFSERSDQRSVRTTEERSSSEPE